MQKHLFQWFDSIKKKSERGGESEREGERERERKNEQDLAR